MKTLRAPLVELSAEKIVKTDNSIIGYDLEGNQTFSLKGITDFSNFYLDGEYDTE